MMVVFFKALKQNLPIKTIAGASEHPVLLFLP